MPGQGAIDQRLKQLKEEVLPFYPFLLTVPTDVPFRLGSRFVNNWAVGKEGPFNPEEQQLQYMTFLTHHEGDSLLVAVGDWSDETERVIMDQTSRPQSAASTPSSGLTKKRISLNDYKNKRQSGTSALPNSQDAASGDTPMPLPSDHKQQAFRANRAENNVTQKQPDTVPARSPMQANTRRKHPSTTPEEHSRSPKGDHTETPSKRQRLSPERISRREPSHSKSNTLPTLLSPTLPPASCGPRLPRLLSPTLPPDIEKELSRPDEKRPAFEPSRTTDLSSPTLPKGHASKAKHPSRNSAQSAGGTVKDPSTGLDFIDNAFPPALKADTPPRKSVNLPQPVSSNVIPRVEMSPANSRENQHAPQGKPQLILKLKYGRSNRRLVEALLKFSGKRKATQSSPPAKERGDNEFRQNKKEARSSELKTSVSEKPQTPVPVSESSKSLLPQHDKAKQDSTVLLKDPRRPTQQRTEMADGDENTPSSLAPKSSSRDPGTTSKRPPPEISDQNARSRDLERRAWKDEFHKFSNLGRELKHAAERHTAKDGVTAIDEKLAVATAIETILCFILAFAADDRSKAVARQVGESSNWLSILAYWHVVKKNSTPYPALHSLCHILGAVSYDAIHALDLERLAISSVPGEHIAAPTPGSDGDTVISDENKRTMKEFLELKNRLPECYKKSQRLWLEGTRGLSENILATQYPHTWSKRSKNYSERGRQQVKAGDYSGEFFLPLERTSFPVEVVRFGWSMLAEWCTKEGVDWKGRLGL